MNIIVSDVAAEHGGALTILKEFYNYVKNNPTPNVKWTFILSTPCLESTEHVNVKNYPWVKKSWFHRLYFDYLVAPKLVTEYKADKVFSLQNICVPRVNKPQIIYVHQSIPFSSYKFSITKTPLLWIYQNIIGMMIKKSIKKSNIVITQTEWMKEACSAATNSSLEKFIVCRPSIDIKNTKKYIDSPLNRSTFIFPASAQNYKNHMLILKTCILLCKENIQYRVIFTINGDESNYANKLKRFCTENDLNVIFSGNLNRELLYDMYSKSVLVFPSLIESFPLPILEARESSTFILAYNDEYSRDALKGYKKAIFFNNNESDLLQKIKQLLALPTSDEEDENLILNDSYSWKKVITTIIE